MGRRVMDKTYDIDAIDEFASDLIQWHQHHVSQLWLIVENKDMDITLNGMPLAADSDTANGIRVGVKIALQHLGELPFKLEDEGDEQTEQ